MAPKTNWTLTEAQAELARRHQCLVSVLAYSFTRDSGLVADLVSVGNESICWAAYCFRPDRGQFEPFARTVVRNDMRDFLTARSARLGREVSQELLVDSPGEEPIVEMDLYRAMDLLPESLRIIVVESVFEGRSMREIGTRRGKSHVWAWMRYHEALEKLRSAAMEMGWESAHEEGDNV